MRLLLLNLFLALVWGALQGRFSPLAFVQGFVIGYLLLWVARRALDSGNYFRSIGRVLSLLVFFSRELLVANIQLAWEVITPGLASIRPGFVAIPLDIKDPSAITLLANMISLTPGTLAVDVASDRSTLYVHALDARDGERLVRQIKDGFERRVREVMGE
jgi:multicomponent Na+:H+ antiporter subunit E